MGKSLHQTKFMLRVMLLIKICMLMINNVCIYFQPRYLWWTTNSLAQFPQKPALAPSTDFVHPVRMYTCMSDMTISTLSANRSLGHLFRLKSLL